MALSDFERTNYGHPVQALSASLVERIKRLRHRRGFNRLLELDDHMLEDIGVNRAEVRTASALPLSVDAATELRRISLERRRRMM